MTAVLDAGTERVVPPISGRQHEFLLLSQGFTDDEANAGLLRPVVAARRGGWIGATVDDRDAPVPDENISLHPIALNRADVSGHLVGLCASSIEPIFHDAVDRPTFEGAWHANYRAVNKRFADKAVELAATGGVVFVYGHHLQLVPAMVRARRPDLLIGFFLDLPFPPGDLFRRLAMRDELLTGVLGADVIGLQSRQSAVNFQQLALDHPQARLGRNGLDISGRTVTVDAFPQSVPVSWLRQQAANVRTRNRAAALRSGLDHPDKVMLAIDDLRPAAGIEQRLAAYEGLLAAGEVDPDETVLIQVIRPDKQTRPQSHVLRARIEQTVGRINGTYGRVGRPALHYIHRRTGIAERLALYTAADVMLSTPLRAGMSRSAKEFVATRADNSGAVVLSEFCATAEELPDAFLVNPYDVEGHRRVIGDILRASPTDLRRRMAAMRRQIQAHDVHHWAGAFLAALGQRATDRCQVVRP
jgi:trehalose 6-phosphate synthase